MFSSIIENLIVSHPMDAGVVFMIKTYCGMNDVLCPLTFLSSKSTILEL